MNGNWTRLLPLVFMVIAALSRWPKLLPPNFSAFYGLAFCAGAFFPRRLKWWLPLGTLLVTDLALIFYYRSFSPWQLANYLGYGVIIWIGTRFNHRSSLLALFGGGILGAVLFYLITNTAAWLSIPAYSKDFIGWFTALTKGLDGYPTTIEFFRNTLLSGGLFTGLFAGAMKLTAPQEAAQEEKDKEQEPAPEGEAEPEEA